MPAASVCASTRCIRSAPPLPAIDAGHRWPLDAALPSPQLIAQGSPRRRRLGATSPQKRSSTSPPAPRADLLLKAPGVVAGVRGGRRGLSGHLARIVEFEATPSVDGIAVPVNRGDLPVTLGPD